MVRVASHLSVTEMACREEISTPALILSPSAILWSYGYPQMDGWISQPRAAHLLGKQLKCRKVTV